MESTNNVESNLAQLNEFNLSQLVVFSQPIINLFHGYRLVVLHKIK
jgi:hypothetical protein